jgi:hypothetical protein
MLISYSHQFIFFHVSKTAGMSMREVLQAYAQEPEKFKIRRPPPMIGDQPNRMYEVWQALLLHARACDAQKELPADVFTSFFKFGFVRNPWDWQVSMYYFILRENTYAKHELVKGLQGFEEYVEWVVSTPDPYPKGTPKLQSETLADAQGNLLVDFVGRYETLTQDFRQVCQRLKIEASLPHLNATAHRDYRTYYNERTKQLIAMHFQADVELFGYTFDGYRRFL